MLLAVAHCSRGDTRLLQGQPIGRTAPSYPASCHPNACAGGPVEVTHVPAWVCEGLRGSLATVGGLRPKNG